MDDDIAFDIACQRNDERRKLAEVPPGTVTLALIDRMIQRLECDLLEAPDWMWGDDPITARERAREELAEWRVTRRFYDRPMRVTGAARSSACGPH